MDEGMSDLKYLSISSSKFSVKLHGYWEKDETSSPDCLVKLPTKYLPFLMIGMIDIDSIKVAALSNTSFVIYGSA